MLRLLSYLAACCLAGQSAAAAERPNVLLIFTDDQGYGDVGCYGSEIPTPAIDSLAADGIKFEQWYVAASICTPSRFGLLTGKYPNRSQDRLLGALMSLAPADASRGIRDYEITLATLLRDDGYRTALIGKWHLGHGAKEFLPTRHGFQSFYGHTAGCIDYFTMQYGVKADWYRDEAPIRETGYATDLLTDAAVEFLGETGEQPFFLYLAYNAPHFGKGWDAGKHDVVNILQPDPRYLDELTHIEDLRRRTFAAMVLSLDQGIARVLEALDENDLRESTLVIFMTDNGGDPNYGGSNKPLNGTKATLYEGGIRVPCLMRWPGRIEAGRVSAQPASALDVLPTVAGVAGIEPPAELDGVDLSPHLFHGESIERELFWRMIGSDAYRAGDWKYLRVGEREMLFNLAEDPGETTDLAEEEPARLAGLKQKHAAVVATFVHEMK